MPGMRRGRRWMGALLAVALGVGASLVATESASAATASFEGHVRTGATTGLYNIKVSVIDDNGLELASDRTDGLGYWQITGVPTGITAHIYVDGTSNGGSYVPEWFQTAYSIGTSSDIQVVAANYPGIDFDLLAGASISGHVTMEVPSTGVFVVAYRYIDTVWTKVGSAALDGAGNYSIKGIKPSTSTTIRFFDRTNVLAGEFYNNKATFDSAAGIFFTGTGDYPGVDATLNVVPNIPVERISGADRYATSAAVSAKFSSLPFGILFVASGANFPDALSAAPVAAFLGAPLLLTDPNNVSSYVLAEIARLHPDRIIIVGGLAVVSQQVESQLGAYAEVARIAGSDRYETSRQLVGAAFLDRIATTDGFVATGNGFADALSLSGLAAQRGGPVLLVPGQNGAIDPASSQLLQDLGTTNIYVAGGPAAVSESMKTSLAGIPAVATVTRLSGADRYATSVDINHQFASANYMYLAVGTGFADALSGAALAGFNKSPLYVVPQNCIPLPVVFEMKRLNPTNIFLLGGESALGAGVFSLTPCA